MGSGRRRDAGGAGRPGDVLRKAIQAHGGWLFKHTGDGVLAAFASPRCAVDAAAAAQRALELPVRMGIATGEAEPRGAGLLTGVELVALGPRRLRDLPNPIGLFQLRAAGLRTDFPPLRALDASPGNLRAATTSFIGRESEVAEVQAAVKAHRLVTLTGTGGVGKTRLATEVAAAGALRPAFGGKARPRRQRDIRRGQQTRDGIPETESLQPGRSPDHDGPVVGEHQGRHHHRDDTAAAMATYAYDQIDQARTELERPR